MCFDGRGVDSHSPWGAGKPPVFSGGFRLLSFWCFICQYSSH